jgi:hypothetical protein
VVITALVLGCLTVLVGLVLIFPGLLISRKKAEDIAWVFRVHYVFGVAAVCGVLASALPFLLARLAGGAIGGALGIVGVVVFFVTLGWVAERLLKRHKMMQGGERT